MSPKVICEVGCNHKGDFELAKEMIKIAKKFCDVDIVKFQKRTPKELLTSEEYNRPHPVPENSYGDTYGRHREFLEFNIKEHEILKKYCEEINVEYSSSVWDMKSAEEIISLKPVMIKIPSAVNNNYELIKYIYKNFNGEIHISFGMTLDIEKKNILRIAKDSNKLKKTVLYHCVSGYPVNVSDLYLLEIKKLIQLHGDEVKCIGFSGHHTGIAADISALTLGAQYIERHFTLDRTWKGTDHAASLEPDGLRRVVRDLKGVSKSLKLKDSEILDVEKVQREKLKFIDIKK